MDITVPFYNEQVSTDDPARAAAKSAGMVLGGVVLLGVVGAASFAYNRITSVAGVDGEDINIPVA